MISLLFRAGLRLAEGAAYFSGAYLLLRHLDKDKARILMYHRIGSRSDGFLPFSTGLYVSPKTFASQMMYLKRHYQVIGLGDYLKAKKEGKRLPPHTVILTFDDGFLDNYAKAYPVLKRLRLPATFFIVASTLQGKLIWLHQYYRLKETLSKNRLLALFRESNPKLKDAKDEGELLRRVKYGMAKQEREEFLRKIFKKAGGATQQRLYCSAEELREMADLVDTGSHSFSHHVLSSLTKKEAEVEICEAKRVLERETAQTIRSFAYPFGNKDTFNKEVIEVLRKHHDCAVTTEEGLNDVSEDPYRLKRISIVEGPGYSFAASLVGVRASVINILRKFTR